MHTGKNSLKLVNIAWVVVIVFSFAIRYPNLYNVSYQWRPLQTEMTAYWFAKEGLNIVNYQTPLYGPPWQVPFEFPLFQAMAAIIFKAGLGNFEFAIRFTALLCFYLSALFLYFLCKRIFPENLTTLIILSLYLFLPYNIYYSTEPLIDYLALSLALAYLYFILSWLKTHTFLWNAPLATIFGTLGILVKPTTIPVVLIPVLVFVSRDILSIYRNDLKPPFNFRGIFDKIWENRYYWLTLIIMAVIPVLIGSIWTRHTDLIKENSIFTKWLASKALVPWNFGTLDLRLDQNIWINYLFVAQRYLLPYGLAIFGILGFFIAIDMVAVPGETTEIRLFIISVIASVGAVLLIFLNLYQHQYYYICLSASMAIIGGYGLTRFWRLREKNKLTLTFMFAIWAFIFIFFNVQDHDVFQNIAAADNASIEQANARARNIQQYISPDEWVIVIAYDWNPSYIYPLERKAMVVTPRELGQPLCRSITDKRFKLVVIGDPTYARNNELLEYTFKCFKSKVEVMPGVFQVQPKNKYIQQEEEQ